MEEEEPIPPPDTEPVSTDTTTTEPSSGKKWNSSEILTITKVLGAIITLVGTFFTVYKPIDSFFEEKRRRYEVEFSTQMIETVRRIYATKDSDSSGKINVDAEILMLSAYELDALPFLLNQMEKAQDPDLVMKSIQTIKNKKRVNDEKMLSIIIQSGRIFFYNKYSPGYMKSENRKGITNYIELMGLIGDSDKDEVEKYFNEIESYIHENVKKGSTLSDDDETIISFIKRSKKALGI